MNTNVHKYLFIFTSHATHTTSTLQWQFVHLTAGTASGVLSMQALLYAIGLGAGALPLAAAINWVLKDGLGQVCILLTLHINFGLWECERKMASNKIKHILLATLLQTWFIYTAARRRSVGEPLWGPLRWRSKATSVLLHCGVAAQLLLRGECVYVVMCVCVRVCACVQIDMCMCCAHMFCRESVCGN